MGQCYITRRGTKEAATLSQLGVYPTGLNGRPSGDVVVIDGTMSLSNYLFKNNDNVVSVSLPNSILTLDNESFQNCVNLQQIVLPKDVEEIPDYCFDGCSDLLKIYFSKSLKYIGTYAFQNCENLKIINIDDSTKELIIKEYAFSNCNNLSNKVITNLATKCIGDTWPYAFANLGKITNVITAKVNDYWFYNCPNLEKVEILMPSDVTGGFGSYIVNTCPKIKEVILPNEATLITANMFNGNSSLQKVNIPTSLISIGANASSSCTSQKQVAVVA